MECNGYDGNELDTHTQKNHINLFKIFPISSVIFKFSWYKALFYDSSVTGISKTLNMNEGLQVLLPYKWLFCIYSTIVSQLLIVIVESF